jgi:Skp family chaperone for outer membrane proteins
MRRSSSFLLGITLMLVLLASSPTAQGKAGSAIGTIDLVTCLILHPSMSSYDPYAQAFRKSGEPPSPDSLAKKAKVHEEEATALRDKVKLIENQMNQTRASHDQEMRAAQESFDQEMNTSASGTWALRREVYQRKIALLDQKFFARMRAFQMQIAQLSDRIDDRTSPGHAGTYLSAKESADRFLRIITEIRKIAQTVAKKRDIEIVLDSSFSHLMFPPRSAGQNLPSNLDYGQIFADMEVPQKLAEDAAALDGFKSIQTSRIEVWHQHRFDILAAFRAQLGQTYVFVGGTDLTKDVLESIFSTYKISKQLQEAMFQAIRREP